MQDDLARALVHARHEMVAALTELTPVTVFNVRSNELKFRLEGPLLTSIGNQAYIIKQVLLQHH